MATQLNLDAETELMIDDLMASGRFAERADVLRHGIRLAFDEDQFSADTPLTPAEIAGIEQGIAEADAGRLIPIEEVMRELERRHAAES